MVLKATRVKGKFWNRILKLDCCERLNPSSSAMLIWFTQWVSEAPKSILFAKHRRSSLSYSYHVCGLYRVLPIDQWYTNYLSNPTNITRSMFEENKIYWLEGFETPNFIGTLPNELYLCHLETFHSLSFLDLHNKHTIILLLWWKVIEGFRVAPYKAP